MAKIAIKTDAEQKVVVQHFMPFDPVDGLGKTQEELVAEGYVFVESIPDPDPTQGYGELFYSVEQGLYYKYTEPTPPVDPEEPGGDKLARLEKRIADLEDKLTPKEEQP